jgi:hypothetical protein
MARKIIVWLAALFIVGNLTIVLIVVLGGKSTPPPVLPNPNGYDDFVKAAQIVASNESKATGSNQAGNYSTMTKEELAKLVSTNQEALTLLRQGLTHESRVPVEYTPEYAVNGMPSLASFKQVAFLFAAEGRLAELEGRTNDAAKSYLDGIRFGQENGRGGVLIQRLVGMACEATATRRLLPLQDYLDAAACRQIAQALEAADARDETAAETIAHEKEFMRRSGGLKGRLAAFMTRNSIQQMLANSNAKITANTLNRRQVMVMYAARAYELEHGKRAQAWTDLAPGILKMIPQDPRTGTNFVFVP